MKKTSRDKDKPKAKPTPDAPLSHNLSALGALKEQLAAEEKARAEKEKLGKPKAPAPAASAPPKMAQPRGAAVSTGRVVDVWRPDLDKDLFNVAMSGVVPLEKDGRKADAVPRLPHSAARDLGTKNRRAQAEGGEQIPVRWDDHGRCEAARPGKNFALEALGRFASPQDRLDLHTLDPAVVPARVADFVRSRRAQNMRVVVIVHGHGKHSPDGKSVLCDTVARALAEPPGSREIDAFRTAEAEHGGLGAVLVALRPRA